MILHCALNTYICHVVCNTNLQECLSDHSDSLFIRKLSTRWLAVPSSSQVHCLSSEYVFLLWCVFPAKKLTLHRDDGFILTSSTNPHVNVMLVLVSTKKLSNTTWWADRDLGVLMCLIWAGWLFIYGSNLPADHLSHTVEFEVLLVIMWPGSSSMFPTEQRILL